ncbi:MAG: AAA family ATPase, partial [Chitinivibrionales bacterium]
MINDQAQRLRELAQQRRNTDTQPAEGAVFARRHNRKASSHVISVCSGKGGVGKSNIALSLALALARLDKKVMLFDADLGLANIHVLLGIAPVCNLSHFVQGTAAFEDILCEGPAGIHVLPGATGIADIANLDQSRLQTIMQKLDQVEQQFDIILLDIGAGVAA